MAFVGAAVFYLWLAISAAIFSAIACVIAPAPAMTRYRIIAVWSRLAILALRLCCRVRCRVVGAENIPPAPAIFLSRHESAWETIAYQGILPPQAFVLKRQLLRIPFFGWGLRQMSPIAIDRAAGHRALRAVCRQGKERLAAGFHVIVFPEGTRLRPRQRRRYSPGGAWLAKRAGAAVIPVAVDSGRCWPKGEFVKRAGVITVSIGEAIDATNLTVDEINARAKKWIESRLPPP